METAGHWSLSTIPGCFLLACLGLALFPSAAAPGAAMTTQLGVSARVVNSCRLTAPAEELSGINLTVSCQKPSAAVVSFTRNGSSQNEKAEILSVESAQPLRIKRELTPAENPTNHDSLVMTVNF